MNNNFTFYRSIKKIKLRDLQFSIIFLLLDRKYINKFRIILLSTQMVSCYSIYVTHVITVNHKIYATQKMQRLYIVDI